MSAFIKIKVLTITRAAASVLFLSAAVLAGKILVTTAAAQTPGQPLVPLGYCQLTSIDAAVLVSSCPGGIPARANAAMMRAEAQAARYRDDGTAPTAAVGMPLLVADPPALYVGTLSKLQVIASTSGAKLNVLFYRAP